MNQIALFQDQDRDRERERQLVHALKFAKAYIAKAIADEELQGCGVSPERALAYIESVLDGETTDLEDFIRAHATVSMCETIDHWPLQLGK